MLVLTVAAEVDGVADGFDGEDEETGEEEDDRREAGGEEAVDAESVVGVVAVGEVDDDPGGDDEKPEKQGELWGPATILGSACDDFSQGRLLLLGFEDETAD